MAACLGGGNEAGSHPDADSPERKGRNQPAPVGQASGGDHGYADLVDDARDENHRADTPDVAASLVTRRDHGVDTGLLDGLGLLGGADQRP
jgi:hypothetical protein